jgi:hypothetical protein
MEQDMKTPRKGKWIKLVYAFYVIITIVMSFLAYISATNEDLYIILVVPICLLQYGPAVLVLYRVNKKSKLDPLFSWIVGIGWGVGTLLSIIALAAYVSSDVRTVTNSAIEHAAKTVTDSPKEYLQKQHDPVQSLCWGQRISSITLVETQLNTNSTSTREIVVFRPGGFSLETEEIFILDGFLSFFPPLNGGMPVCEITETGETKLLGLTIGGWQDWRKKSSSSLEFLLDDERIKIGWGYTSYRETVTITK